MGIALGLDAPEGVWLPSRYHTQYYDEIPGVSVDGSSIQKLWGDSGVGKEQFYEIDADIHVMDPNFLQSRGSWEQSDIDEIETQVGPFFGNSIFSTGYEWHDYTYYTLYEAFEKLSQAFQRTDRFEAFRTLHEEFQTSLEDLVPDSESDRPEVAIMWAGSDEPPASHRTSSRTGPASNSGETSGYAMPSRRPMSGTSTQTAARSTSRPCSTSIRSTCSCADRRTKRARSSRTRSSASSNRTRAEAN